MYKITKEFHFSSGHRVHCQKLNGVLSEGADTACKFVHGHNYIATVNVESKKLHNHMVLDFKNLSFIKTFVDDYLDHKFIIDINDPIFNRMVGNVNLIPTEFMGVKIGSVIDLGVSENEEREYLQSFFVVDFVPTSENLVVYLQNIVSKIINNEINELNLKVSFSLSETPKTSATYYG